MVTRYAAKRSRMIFAVAGYGRGVASDDVYLRHVGHRFTDNGEPATVGARCPMMLDTWWMTHRQLKALLPPARRTDSSACFNRPWQLLFGNLFRRIIELPGFGTTSYLRLSGTGAGAVTERRFGSDVCGPRGLENDRRDRAGTLNRFPDHTYAARRPSSTQNVIVQAGQHRFQWSSSSVRLRRAGARYPGGLVERLFSCWRRSRSAPSSVHCPACACA